MGGQDFLAIEFRLKFYGWSPWRGLEYLMSFFRFPVIRKFSEIAIEFNFDGGRANLANPINFSGNLSDSPDSRRVRKF